MYAVHAAIVRVQPDGWVGVRTTPTFYLDPAVQGIVNTEHAESVAREIVGTFTRPEETITAVVVVDVSAPQEVPA